MLRNVLSREEVANIAGHALKSIHKEVKNCSKRKLSTDESLNISRVYTQTWRGIRTNLNGLARQSNRVAA